MRKLAASILAMVVLSVDVPARAQNAAIPFNWSGFYLGIAGGYGAGHSGQSDNLPPPGPTLDDCGGDCPGDGNYSPRGSLVGGSLGYNWQLGSWVAGIEGDYSYASISGHADNCGLVPHQCGARLGSLGTLRGRLGYASDQWLPFVSGGWAFGDLHAFDVTAPASGSKLRDGWTLGGGLEAQLARTWSVKIEYLYVDLGTAAMFDIRPGFPERVSFRTNIIRAGVNHSFDWGVPLVTKH
jgi:outer membrane immunogenic protein